MCVQAGEVVRTKGAGGGGGEDTAPALAPGMSSAEQLTLAGSWRLHDLLLKVNKELSLDTRRKRLRTDNSYRL